MQHRAQKNNHQVLVSSLIWFSFMPFSRLINFVRQRRKTAKNVGSGTQTIAPIKQTEKSLGPVGSVFKKKFLNIFLKPMHSK